MYDDLWEKVEYVKIIHIWFYSKPTQFSLLQIGFFYSNKIPIANY
jgi:hypothetical protein